MTDHPHEKSTTLVLGGTGIDPEPPATRPLPSSGPVALVTSGIRKGVR